ncbi:WXG100 family type VII secretion target [Streptomyces bohaiensis]|uniref:ESAT-6-like protein n=1 Tax=Streptomyces bohaiensis TaxID=1431344 RepID=A0ABX1CDL7_9ACTN|nr:WXG100 family type VII secretion target [Streptomyces bohaiensis]NJQ16003.1 WXG100 family type VII secretion target [Streptomyces bohaiensis]
MSQFDDGTIFMDYKGVDDVVDRLRMETRDIRAMMASMEQGLGPLRNSWVGDASAMYTQKQAAWNRAMEAMDNLLEKDAQVLEGVRSGYRRRETSLAQTWGELKIGR